MSETVTIKAVCSSCSGTGLYQGMAERGGAFVVCSSCKGTGCVTITREVFVKRKPQPKCKRVYKNGCGYCITDHDVTAKDGTLLEFSTAGVTYQEWLEGKNPGPMKFLGCPMSSDQGACHHKKGFVEECNRLHGGYFSLITDCKHQSKKHECWARFEKGE